MRFQEVSSKLILAAVCCALPASACQGRLAGAEDNASGPDEPAKPDDKGGPSGNGASALPPPGQSCAANVDPGRTVIRRLTRDEYDNTVRDLLGDTSRPGRGFPDDDQSAADQLILTALLFEKYETAANTLIETAWQRDEQGGAKSLLACVPRAGDAACAQRIVRSFARKAFRRPVSDEELSKYYALATFADPVAGTKAALKALLLSPHFLFRIEVPETGDTASPARLTNHQLAARLSYTLWASTPDAKLDELADSGQLGKPEVLAAEIRRMLGDPKAAALADSFAARWLGFADVRTSKPDPQLCPNCTTLLPSMERETALVMRELIALSRPLTDVLDVDFTFVDAALAKHYGLPAPADADGQPRRVSLPDGPRRGVLGHGSFLLSTSPPNRTSPVKRGKWVAAKLLCSAPPPPPPGEDIPSEEAKQATTERERLAIHRQKPQCAVCHQLIDPIGLGLDSFDQVGRHRTEVKGQPIDDSGVLPGGATFRGPRELAALIRSDRRYAECTAQHMLTWSLGRVPDGDDLCLQGELADTIAKPGATLVDVFATIVKSRAFQHRRGEAAGATP